MRLKLLLLLLIGTYMVAEAEEIPTNLVVWAKEGTKVAYALTDEPKITFTETDMVIKAKDVEVNYAIDNFARFTYEGNEQTAIRNIQTGESTFKLQGESLLFPMLKPNDMVAIYELNGAVVVNKVIAAEGEYAFPLSNLKVGVYIVDINGLTYKIIKK